MLVPTYTLLMSYLKNEIRKPIKSDKENKKRTFRFKKNTRNVIHDFIKCNNITM